MDASRAAASCQEEEEEADKCQEARSSQGAAVAADGAAVQRPVHNGYRKTGMVRSKGIHSRREKGEKGVIAQTSVVEEVAENRKTAAEEWKQSVGRRMGL